jgi:hypothetical protein
MIVALLGLLGVPLWLLLGWVGAGIWHRHDLKQNLPKLFKMKVRVVKGTYRHIDDKFSRTAALGIWAHDVMVLEKGLLVGRNIHFSVADGAQPPHPADPKQVKHLGDNPIIMQFQLDDDTIIEIAASGENEELARGPFFSGPNQYSDEPAPDEMKELSKE